MLPKSETLFQSWGGTKQRQISTFLPLSDSTSAKKVHVMKYRSPVRPRVQLLASPHVLIEIPESILFAATAT